MDNQISILGVVYIIRNNQKVFVTVGEATDGSIQVQKVTSNHANSYGVQVTDFGTFVQELLKSNRYETASIRQMILEAAKKEDVVMLGTKGKYLELVRHGVKK